MAVPIVNTYSANLTTGLITGVAAGTASAGHIGAFRWSSTTKYCLIRRMKATWVTTTGFTAAQTVGLDMVNARGYSASHSGGTAIVGGINVAGEQMKLWARHASSTAFPFSADSAIGSLYIATTGALTDGTHSAPVTSSVMAQGWSSELAAAATVQKNRFSCEVNYGAMGVPGFRLNTDEGIILRNLVAMGAGGVAIVVWEIDWTEVPI